VRKDFAAEVREDIDNEIRQTVEKIIKSFTEVSEIRLIPAVAVLPSLLREICLNDTVIRYFMRVA